MVRYFGSTDIIVFKSFSKSMLRSLSASSKTKYLIILRLKPFVFFRWYRSLPGLAIIMWGFFAKAIDYVIASKPPISTQVFKLIPDPKAFR